jgi:hypothetical protein
MKDVVPPSYPVSGCITDNTWPSIGRVLVTGPTWLASADWNTARYLTGAAISSKTRSAEPRPAGFEPATATATAGRCATAEVTLSPVKGAVGAVASVDPVDAVAVVAGLAPPAEVGADAAFDLVGVDEALVLAEHPARAVIAPHEHAATAYRVQVPQLDIFQLP